MTSGLLSTSAPAHVVPERAGPIIARSGKFSLLTIARLLYCTVCGFQTTILRGLREKRSTRDTCRRPMNNLVGSTELRRHPEVLHIGFSKCASTYLRALFRSQSRVHMVFKSGFFTPFLAKDMSFEQYQSLFRDEDGIVNVESDEHLTLPGV